MLNKKKILFLLSLFCVLLLKNTPENNIKIVHNMYYN
jgi:hypothetical protein